MRATHRSANRDGTPPAMQAASAIALAAVLGICGGVAPSLASEPSSNAAATPTVTAGRQETVFTFAAGEAAEESRTGAVSVEDQATEEPQSGEARRGGESEYLYLAGVAGLGLLFGGAGGGGGAADEVTTPGFTAGGGSGASSALNRSTPDPGGSGGGGGGNGSVPGEVMGEVVLTPAPPEGSPDAGRLPLADTPSFGDGGVASNPPIAKGGGGGPADRGDGSSGGVVGDILLPTNRGSGTPVTLQSAPEPGAVATLLIFGGALGGAILRGRRRRLTRTA